MLTIDDFVFLTRSTKGSRTMFFTFVQVEASRSLKFKWFR
jgi:hypothetical protein